MADKSDDRVAELDLIETLYGDPLRLPTLKAGRNLLVASLLLIAIIKFGAQLQPTSLFPISFKQPDVLPTLMALLVGLLLLNFMVRVFMDIGLLFEGEQRVKAYMWTAKVEAAIQATTSTPRLGPSSRRETRTPIRGGRRWGKSKRLPSRRKRPSNAASVADWSCGSSNICARPGK